MKQKFCCVCGMKMPANTSRINMPALNQNIKNKEYWYVHSSCNRIALTLIKRLLR